MSNHEIAQGQKTARRVIASRRLRHSVTLVSSAPPHRADTSGYPPQHPLPTRRAGVASLISAIIPDALIGSDPVHPCGRCRQILNEAAERSKTDILVHCASGDGSAVATYRLSELLPAAFGPKDLGMIPD